MGGFNDLRKNGFGVIDYPDRNKFEGEFKYVQPLQGEGIYINKGNIKFKGKWKNGNMDGYALVEYPTEKSLNAK